MAEESVDNVEETAAAAGEDGATAEAVEEPTAAESSESAAAEAAAEATVADEAIAEPVAQPAVAIQPDVKFVREIMAAGGGDLKKCYQCATCSVVCNLTPDAGPFPRKEMMWAQWGLKDKLVGDPDIWLCHQCSDCVAHCPRGAKPGRVMQAIAKMTLPSLSKPSFLAKGVGSPSSLLLMLAIPVIILIATIALLGDFTPARGELVNGKMQHAGEIVYGQFLGHWPIVGVYTTFFLLSTIIFALGVKTYWGMMKQHAASEGTELKSSGLSQIVPVLTEVVTHKRFGKCDETKDRKTSHLFVFFAFLLLFGATGLSTLFTDLPLLWGGEGVLSPYADYHPVKWFGYSGMVAGLVGIGLMTMNRFKHQEKIGLGSYFDWLLIVLVVTLMITGSASVLFRKLDLGVLAYPTYFVHLTAVLFLFIYAPFSKMAHMVYRTAALAFARATQRDMGVE